MILLALFAAAALAVSASPVERQAKTAVLPLKHITNVKSMKNIVARGRARINAINGVHPASDTSEDGNPQGGNLAGSSGTATNDDVTYVAPVSIGGTEYQLIVDTGSSNTWCGAQGPCETKSGTSTGDSVSVTYGSGSFSGTEYVDTVSFAGLTVRSQSIGAATVSSGFNGVDGIMGLGPVDLTQGTVSNTNTVPTFMDNLYKQGSISTEVLGVSFRPEIGSDTGDTNGELTLGGVDSTRYSGSITYFPTLTSGDASSYWGIAITSFTYGSTILGLPLSGIGIPLFHISGIVDTGTTLIYIPTLSYNKFLLQAGGQTDSSSGLASFTTAPTGNFGIKFGSTTYTLTPSQYLIPAAQYSDFGLSSGKYYAWIADGGSTGVNTIIGQKFMENYYAVFDTTNSRIGFATAA